MDPASDPTPAAPVPPASPEEPSFSSSHTTSFPALLKRLGISVLVSTYQAGKLIVLRAEGDTLNTHFRPFTSPMGIAYEASTGKLAIGTRNEVCYFRNQPAVCGRLEPKDQHDAAFLPRTHHFTGDIRIHEVEWLQGELWAVNTRFSCLCTFDAEYSFQPRWRPKFITGLAPEDRCHLNGFMSEGGRPKFVTCLGLTDTAGGWRENKRDGGCLLDIDSQEVVLQGLCMPHSPRFYAGKYWILESGFGTLSNFDPATGKTTEVTRVPGFTRGLAFHGNIAFIGLSQVRETATFSGIPLLELVPERTCGVWAVDIRNGQTVAFLRFEGIVQEIFAITVLPGIRFPDIINEDGPVLNSSFVLPDESLAEVPQNLRS